MSKTVPFQPIQFSISTQFKWKYSLTVKNILFQAIQFRQTVLIQTIQSGPGSDGKEGMLYIPQISSFTETPQSDCLVSYLDTRLGRVLPLCRGGVGIFYRLCRMGKMCVCVCVCFCMSVYIYIYIYIYCLVMHGGKCCLNICWFSYFYWTKLELNILYILNALNMLAKGEIKKCLLLQKFRDKYNRITLDTFLKYKWNRKNPCLGKTSTIANTTSVVIYIYIYIYIYIR